jgi:integrase
VEPKQDIQPESRKREEHLSNDGKWRSFPKVPHLLQYVSNGNYYGRIKMGGKTIRQSLETTVWTIAKVRLTDFLKERQEIRPEVSAPTFGDAVALFKQELENDATIKGKSKEYRLLCLHKIETSWPGLAALPLNEITEESCKEWASRLNGKISCHYYNNTIGTLRQILDAGIRSHKTKTGSVLENPAKDLKRVRVRQKDLQLPESAQFKVLVDNIRNGEGGWSERVADLVEFLAYSGMRVRSEAVWVTWEDVDWQRKQIIVRGHPETVTKNGEIRRIPIFSDMENLLNRLKDKLGTVTSGTIIKVSECNASLARACKEVGISKLTHHDFRHLFATRCIESGVDIPTVSKWLGHKDGGALAMKVYGHLRNEHSRAMAEKVKF